MSYKVIWQIADHRQAAPFAADCPHKEDVTVLVTRILTESLSGPEKSIDYLRVERKRL